MAVDEARRRDLFQALSETIGEDATRTMFDMLPPDGAEVATLDDLLAVESRLQRRFDERFGQVDGRFEGIDRRFEQIDRRFEEVDARFEQVDRRFDALEERFDLKLGSVRDQLLAAMEQKVGGAIVSQTRIIVVSLLTAFVAVAGVALGVAFTLG